MDSDEFPECVSFANSRRESFQGTAANNIIKKRERDRFHTVTSPSHISPKFLWIHLVLPVVPSSVNLETVAVDGTTILAWSPHNCHRVVLRRTLSCINHRRWRHWKHQDVFCSNGDVDTFCSYPVSKRRLQRRELRSAVTTWFILDWPFMHKW